VHSLKVLAIVVVVSCSFFGKALANPLDSPGTVYIDGSPCNLSCQSYMAWSRQILEARQAVGKRADRISATKTSGVPSGKLVSKRVERALADTPSRSRPKDLRATLSAIPAPLPRSRTEVTPRNEEVHEPPALLGAPSEPPAIAKSATENVPIGTKSGNSRDERTSELVTAALAVAEKMTSAEALPRRDDKGLDEAKAGSANVSTSQVALLISRPDVKSVSALRGLNVAINVAQSAAETDIRSALAALGATETQLLVSDASPIDRLISGDAQAAVVSLVSTDAANAFPDIKGFNVFRVTLSFH
jgi:hypothetical protein